MPSLMQQSTASCRPSGIPAVPRRCCAAAAGSGPPPGGNLSRRRSQRLRQPRDADARDLQRQLREREARLEERQRLMQQQQQAGVAGEPQQQEGEQRAGGAPAAGQGRLGSEAQRLQEQAARSLLADLMERQQGPGEERAQDAGGATRAAPPGAAAAELAAQQEQQEEAYEALAGPDDPAAAGSSVGGSKFETVEADFILEQQGAQAVGAPRPQQAFPSEISRQSEALLAIIEAGERVEEVIEERRADIDGTTLKLLSRRIVAAQQVERRPDVVEGLRLLYRRLKAELDRQSASPELRLLDELMGILDVGDADTLSQLTTQEERKRQAAARARAAFSGGLASDADVLSLAAQLGGGGGERLADELVADPVDPMAFMAEATQLLGQVEEQETQLEAYLAQLQAQQAQQAGTGRDGQAAERQGAAEQALGLGEEEEEPSDEEKQLRRQTLEVEGLLEQRRSAAALVQQSLEVTQAVMQQLQLGG